jgi:hypothetical protein
MNHSIKVACYPDTVRVRRPILIAVVAAFGVTASLPELASALTMFTFPAPPFPVPSLQSASGLWIHMIGGFLRRLSAAARLRLRK